MITIRRAEIEDIPVVMRFLDEHWKPGHILATDRTFFEWQYVEDGKVNVFIGIDEDEKKVYWTLGVILYNHSDQPDGSGCMWQTIKSSNPLLGVEIMDYAFKTLNVRYGDAPYLTKKAVRLFELQGKTCVQMDHFYRINSDLKKEDFRIAQIKDDYVPDVSGMEKKDAVRLVRLDTVEKMKQFLPEQVLKEHVHSKDYRYIERRYFEHPVYHYDVWGLKKDHDGKPAVMITRAASYEGAFSCKIIDYYGDPERLAGAGAAIDVWIRQEGYEFIDVYSYGFPSEVYERAGLLRWEEHQDNILPDYFHPFVRGNVTRNLLKPDTEKMMMFRGDGDQDRPA